MYLPAANGLGHSQDLPPEAELRLPIASISPALFVGEVPLVEYEGAGPNTYRFFAFESSKLRQGDPISLGWPYAAERRVRTNFRYQPRVGIPAA
jgi:hypothetical protein